jgi:hypothetical protein
MPVTALLVLCAMKMVTANAIARCGAAAASTRPSDIKRVMEMMLHIRP